MSEIENFRNSILNVLAEKRSRVFSEESNNEGKGFSSEKDSIDSLLEKFSSVTIQPSMNNVPTAAPTAPPTVPPNSWAEALSSYNYYNNLMACKFNNSLPAASNPIRYYTFIQYWTRELIENLDKCDKEKSDVVQAFNIISLNLSKNRQKIPSLTEKEYELLESRRIFFKDMLSLNINDIKSKILAVKRQADDLEHRIDDINNGNNSIYELALLEKEERANALLIVDNTREIIMKSLRRINYLDEHRQFVSKAVDILDKWTNDYEHFKGTYIEKIRQDCEKDEIEKEIQDTWCSEWTKLRFAIEEKIKPLLEWGLSHDILTENESEITVTESLETALKNYKNSVDKFYLEKRKGIYQQVSNKASGDFQDKTNTEKELWELTNRLQKDLQKIIFNCVNFSDRIFIVNWSKSLPDIQIDEIVTYIQDNNLKNISQSILDEFAALRQKTYEEYLSDVKAYCEAMEKRANEYNSLLFKMNKDMEKLKG